MAAEKKKLTYPLPEAGQNQEMFCKTYGLFTLLPHLLVSRFIGLSCSEQSELGLGNMVKESEAFIVRYHTSSPRRLMLKKPKLPNGSQQSIFKGKVREEESQGK